MTEKEFANARKNLAKTQKKLAEILGTSLKAIHSYEQGWRTIPLHIERQLYFLMAQKTRSFETRKPCWTIKKCPPERKEQCPAWEFKAGKLCWFINGTICECINQDNWQNKMEVCKKCKVFGPTVSNVADKAKNISLAQ